MICEDSEPFEILTNDEESWVRSRCRLEPEAVIEIEARDQTEGPSEDMLER